MKNGSKWLLWIIIPLFALLLSSCDLHKKLAWGHYEDGVKKYNAGNYAGAIDDFSGPSPRTPTSPMLTRIAAPPSSVSAITRRPSRI